MKKRDKCVLQKRVSKHIKIKMKSKDRGGKKNSGLVTFDTSVVEGHAVPTPVPCATAAFLAQSQAYTYKHAINSVNVTYKLLGPLNVACIHSGALHFPVERVANKDNSFEDCCLHVRLALSPPQIQNELVCLF